MMEFYYYEEYLTSVSKKILLWQCREKQVFIQLIYADWWKINNVKENPGEKLIQTSFFSKLPSAHEVLKKKDCSVLYIIELFLLQGTEHKVDPS